MKREFWYHFVALLTVAIWGSTFVFTKMLLQNGLSPAQIFTLRFVLAYVLMEVVTWVAGRKVKWLSNSVRDELIMVLLGVTGGSLYFLTENASLVYTTATNTSLIVCTCPIFAMLLLKLCDSLFRHGRGSIERTVCFASIATWRYAGIWSLSLLGILFPHDEGCVATI